jgi:hypothetical protein
LTSIKPATVGLPNNSRGGFGKRPLVHKRDLLCTAHVNPLPEISHSVEVTLMQVADPFAASVREPVVPAGDKRIVSVVMAIVTTPAPFWLINVKAVPMG